LSFSHLELSVLEKIRPLPEEIAHVGRVAEQLIGMVSSGGNAEGLLVGSVARNTFIRGDRDLDIFMLFAPEISRDELEYEGLRLAKEIAEHFGAEYREKYAEHPYINARIDGLDVDLVPCYRVASAAGIQSAVDRTPFHTRYIVDRIGPYADDVLLLKQFAKGGGVYGSDQMTEGFAGYLCELLVLHYGGFHPLIEAAAAWRPGTVIDLLGHGAKDFAEPLVVVDPVDPNRNVSASLSLTRMCEFIELARGYLEHPSPAFFFSPKEEIISREEVREHLKVRGTFLYALIFDTPPLIEDIVVPQLRKSTDAVRSLLERHGFMVNRCDCAMEEDLSMILIELLVDTLPAIRRHEGPPAWTKVNAKKFTEKYHDLRQLDLLAGPFIEDGKYIVEISRNYPNARDLLKSHLVLEVGLGKHVKQSMEEFWELREAEECWMEPFSLFITRFIQKESPLMRIRRSEPPGGYPGLE
jgi:tRNA nucleotidyltransferase (CCA-adding enzyme)